jgi:HPt (histidine-containing phosphotransfer) domain-containing protein
MSNRERSLVAELPSARRLLQSYVDHRRRDVAVLFGCADAGDFETVARIGHAMRGSAPSYGFPELAALGEWLETAAAARSADAVRDATNRLSAWVVAVGLPAALPASGTYPRAQQPDDDEPEGKA